MLHTLQSFLRISRKKERTLVDSYMNALAVKAPSMEQLTKNLSGGNQQKVVVAKWLATNADTSFWTSRHGASISAQNTKSTSL